jgi:hypothetical protein
LGRGVVDVEEAAVGSLDRHSNRHPVEDLERFFVTLQLNDLSSTTLL